MIGLFCSAKYINNKAAGFCLIIRVIENERQAVYFMNHYYRKAYFVWLNRPDIFMASIFNSIIFKELL